MRGRRRARRSRTARGSRRRSPRFARSGPGSRFRRWSIRADPARDLLAIAEQVALGRWAYAAGRFDEAANHYRAAAEIEGRLPYLEPPWWYYPVRQSLGAALFRAGRHEEARDAFRAALVRSPNNGWVLYGLAQSERALGHTAEAAAAEAALERAWLGERRWLRMDRL